MDERARQAANGDRVQADDAVPDSEHGDYEHLAVDLSDVLGQHGGRLGRHARLWAAGELDAGLADQGDPEARDAVGARWAWAGHGITFRRAGGGGLSLRPRPAA